MNLRSAAKICLRTASASMLLLIASCGGNGGRNNSSDLPSKQMMEAANAVHQKILTLKFTNRDQLNQEILKYMRLRPEFTSVGITEDGAGIYGVFENGEPYIVFNDMDLDAYNRNAKSNEIVASRTGIPLSSQARIYNTLPNYTNPFPELVPLLSDPNSGYYVIQGSASLEELGQVKGDGLFFIQTHGLLYKPKNRYLMGTSTELPKDINGNSIFEEKYKIDLNEGRIGSGDFVYGVGPDGRVLSRINYYITNKFVEEYMEFSKDSLVLIQACQSDNKLAKDAFFHAGASVYAGWTEIVDSALATKAAKYTISGLLGDHSSIPAKDFMKISNELFDLKLDYDPKTGAKLNFTLGRDNFEQLAPSIQNADFNPRNNTLILNGSFGSDPAEQGQVTLGVLVLQSRNRIKWSADQLVYKLDGIPGGTYNVNVSVRGHKSNIVPITISDFVYTYQYTSPNFSSFISEGPNPYKLNLTASNRMTLSMSFISPLPANNTFDVIYRNNSIYSYIEPISWRVSDGVRTINNNGSFVPDSFLTITTNAKSEIIQSDTKIHTLEIGANSEHHLFYDFNPHEGLRYNQVSSFYIPNNEKDSNSKAIANEPNQALRWVGPLPERLELRQKVKFVSSTNRRPIRSTSIFSLN